MASAMIQAIQVKDYGVLGSSTSGPKESKPDQDTAFVDPAGLHHIREGPWGAAGAAGANYKWLGIDEDESFPEDVTAAITEPLQAKFHAYGEDGSKKCIHVVGPDFREKDRDFQREHAVKELAQAYGNVLTQFLDSGLKKLRLLPISGGIFSGPFRQELPELTAEALQVAYDTLEAEMKKHVDESTIEMCIFVDAELESFRAAFGKKTEE